MQSTGKIHAVHKKDTCQVPERCLLCAGKKVQNPKPSCIFVKCPSFRGLRTWVHAEKNLKKLNSHICTFFSRACSFMHTHFKCQRTISSSREPYHSFLIFSLCFYLIIQFLIDQNLPTQKKGTQFFMTRIRPYSRVNQIFNRRIFLVFVTLTKVSKMSQQ